MKINDEVDLQRLHEMICPKCDTVFAVPKGVFMGWDFTKPIPVDLREETPFHCPTCKYTMCVLDEDFNEYVKEVVFAD